MGESEIFHRLAFAASLISAVCVLTLTLVIPMLYSTVNTAEMKLSKRMEAFRVISILILSIISDSDV